MNTQVNIFSLPSEVLVHILSYVNEDGKDNKKVAEPLGKLAVVSKRFKKASEVNQLWKRVAEKYAILIDQKIIHETTIKMQIKDSIIRANTVAKILVTKDKELPTEGLCSALSTYPFQKICNPITDPDQLTAFLTEVQSVLKTKMLSDADIMMIVFQLVISFKTCKEDESDCRSDIIDTLFVIIRSLIDAGKSDLLKKMFDIFIEHKIAGKFAMDCSLYIEMNPLIISDKTAIDILRSAMDEHSFISRLDLSIYEKLGETGDLWTWMKELPKSQVTELSSEELVVNDSLKNLKIAKYLLDASRDWPNPKTILEDILKQRLLLNSETVRAVLQPLFDLYSAEYNRLLSEATVVK